MSDIANVAFGLRLNEKVVPLNRSPDCWNKESCLNELFERNKLSNYSENRFPDSTETTAMDFSADLLGRLAGHRFEEFDQKTDFFFRQI